VCLIVISLALFSSLRTMSISVPFDTVIEGPLEPTPAVDNLTPLVTPIASNPTETSEGTIVPSISPLSVNEAVIGSLLSL
jgi:hypothetical protein